MTTVLQRREVLVGLAAVCVARVGVAAAAQPAAMFSGLRVDTGPLAFRGGGGAATLIQTIMPGKLEGVFRDLVAPAARTLPVLVARVDTLYLPGDAGPRASDRYFVEQDSMTGAGVVVAGGHDQSVTPLHVTLPASYSGVWYLPDIDTRRIDSLCYQFAYWLRREMQL